MLGAGADEKPQRCGRQGRMSISGIFLGRAQGRSGLLCIFDCVSCVKEGIL